jgi:hypothetical protein
MPRTLIAYHSRSGYTKQLAMTLAHELITRGHDVSIEFILPSKERNKWLLVPPLLPLLPFLPLYLIYAPFRRWWLARYRQAEQAIQPLKFPDVSAYDLILLGGPKWLYISYPVARYLNTVEGLSGKPVGCFATFCGPPLEIFEKEMLFSPLTDRITVKGATVTSTLAISSAYHPFFWSGELEWLFGWISQKAFKRPLITFTLGSEWGRGEIKRFCDEVTFCLRGK